MQFKAGYIIDSIANVISNFKSNLDRHSLTDQTKFDEINGLLHHVSSFDVEFPYNHNPDFTWLHPVLATLNNIITRGLPTRAPIILENLFSEIGLTGQNADEFEFNFHELKIEINYEQIFNLLHIIEPGLEIEKEHYAGKLGSAGEWHFLNVLLEKHPYAKQILQSQREFATINKKLNGGRSIDFSYEFPYINSINTSLGRKGVIFEYDGAQHKINSYKYYDVYRDAVAEESNFETLRQPAEVIHLDPLITNQFRNVIFKIFEQNFRNDISEHLEEYSLIFIPLAVARVQKTILEFLIANSELLKKDKISIGIIERDLPCGAIAVQSLKEYLHNINSLLVDEYKMHIPEFQLVIFETEKWVINPKFHLQAKIEDEIFFTQNQFDLIIDHSILRRSSIYKESNFQSDNIIKIRSSHFYDKAFGRERRTYCADYLHYKSIVRKKDDGSFESIQELLDPLLYFIRNIFRKKEFREGQIPIISRALQRKPVIGLLPTGAGKSLTFQLAAFMQPGLCVVVDPIKSLMEDQVRVLKENWIDCCAFINANLTSDLKRKRLIDFRYGECMFLFVSPERFVMLEFRNIISTIDALKFGLAFSYCVIDEVHCVSEWGHDFRTTYLMLGINAQKFAKSKNGGPVTLIGLTATASFDVLSDIERELRIDHKDVADAIIMIENTIRPELFFRVIDVTGKNRMNILNDEFSKMGVSLQKLNDPGVIEQSKKHHLENFNPEEKFSENILFQSIDGQLINLGGSSSNDFYSIVFCLVKGKKGNEQGVNTIYQNLNSNSKGYFYAEDELELNAEIQSHFQSFVSGKTKHMVCTKAFGMGIDKKDIRNTYHFVYPGSLESLVQEAGRSGRDKKISQANILFSSDANFKINVYQLFKDNIKNSLFQNKHTRKAIRLAFDKKWDEKSKTFINRHFSSLQNALQAIESENFKLVNFQQQQYNILPDDTIKQLKEKILERNANEIFKYIIEKNGDRNMHDYFHGLSFKGVDTEKSQFLNLFKVREFQLVNEQVAYLENQESLEGTFNKCKSETFQFLITSEKINPNSTIKICDLLKINPEEKTPYSEQTYKKKIETTFNYSYDFNDFLLLLDEGNVRSIPSITNDLKDSLLFVYSRDRENNDTGRLIYRMHSMGFLIDYLVDYNKNNLFTCTFRKYSSIYEYILKIENYLGRYLSENAAKEYILKLKQRLTNKTLIDDIIECLYFLSEFASTEIASKRKRATDEIEQLLTTSIGYENTKWFDQNIYVKEQIYFYFNAKYARIGFMISGKLYSLLDDYKDQSTSKQEILIKYLDVFQLDGTEQNNYKHMIGSCKKILGSLGQSDLKNDWVLHLLKGFSMYSINNESYMSEANSELELGLLNLYNDEIFHGNNFDSIELVLDAYFSKLLNNIDLDNPSFKCIELIRVSLLLKMQSLRIEMLFMNNQELGNKYA